ncbi:MAG: hypothetical protein EA414_01250 [Arthrospira sp. PLM2.Bin9]|nr:MAG: hypothetical protein EA414_01250 [Arthrospira sp. PLM2.Bin9]
MLSFVAKNFLAGGVAFGGDLRYTFFIMGIVTILFFGVRFPLCNYHIQMISLVPGACQGLARVPSPKFFFCVLNGTFN